MLVRSRFQERHLISVFLRSVSALFLICIAGCPPQIVDPYDPDRIPANTIVDSEPVGQVAGSLSVDGNGAANYTIPIAVPEGRAGLQPALSLSYSSRSGNGTLGVGWSVSGLSVITRCPRNYAQDGNHQGILFDTRDALCIDGRRLVLVRGEIWEPNSEYRTEHESYTRVIARGVGENGPRWFEVWSRDGRVAFYGERPGQTQYNALVTATQFDYEQPNPVARRQVSLSWAITRIEDRFGNYLEVDYERSGDGSPSQPLEHRPSQIRYTGFAPPQGVTAPVLPPLRRVNFVYEDQPRPDVIDGYLAGVHLTTTRRLSRIESLAPTATGATPVIPTEFISIYRFEYDNPAGHLSQRSRLASVVQCDGREVCKPPTRFTWSHESGEYQQRLTPILSPPVAPDTSLLQVLDFDADGRDDIAYLETLGQQAWRIRARNDGTQYVPQTGTVPEPHILPPDQDRPVELEIQRGDGIELTGRAGLFSYTPATLSPTIDNQQIFTSHGQGAPFLFADFDGDGLQDRAYIRNTRQSQAQNCSFQDPWRPECFGPPFFLQIPRSRSGNNYPEDVMPFAPMSPVAEGIRSWGDLHSLRLVDYDGDGRMDLLFHHGAIPTFYSRLVVEPGQPARVEATSLRLPAANSNVFCPVELDLNGDGLTDTIELPAIWDTAHPPVFRLNTGQGYQQLAMVPMSVPENFNRIRCRLDGSLRDADQVRVLDYNHDGLSDLLVWTPGAFEGPLAGFRIFINRRTRFDEVRLPFHPFVTGGGSVDYSSPNVFVGDVDGNGLADIIQPTGLTSPSGRPLIEWIVRQGATPDLLVAVDDGLGARAEVSYKPLNDPSVHTPNRDCRYPVRCLSRDALPLVSEVRHSDGSGGLRATSYQYFGAMVDVRGRGWLGFSRRIVRDVRSGAEELSEFLFQRNAPFEGPYAYPFAQTPVRVLRRIPVDDKRIDVTEVLFTFDNRQENVRAPYETLLRERRGRHWELPSGFSILDLTPGVLDSFTSRSSLLHEGRLVIDNYDEFGNALGSLTRNEITGSSITITQEVTNRPEQWLLGLVTQRSALYAEPGSTPTQRRWAFNYDENTGWLRSETREPDESETSSLRQTTTFEPTSFGTIGRVATRGVADAGSARIDVRAQRITYDSEGLYPRTITSELAGGRTLTTTTFFHRGLGYAAITRDANGLESRNIHDRFGRPRGFVSPTGASGTINYSAGAGNLGLITSVRTSDGAEAREHFDLLGRTTSSQHRAFDGRWVMQEMFYDDRGRPNRASLPHFEGEATSAFTSVTYDGLDRVRQTRLPEPGAYTEAFYAGLDVLLVDVLGRSRSVRSDAQGRMFESIEAQGTPQQTRTTYVWRGPFGVLSSVQDHAGNVSSIQYDRLGRRTLLTDPDTGIQAESYNSFGDVVRHTDSVNSGTSAVTFDFDLLGRAVSRTSREGVTEWEWDTAERGLGMLSRTRSPAYAAANGRIEQEFAYNARGLPERVRTVVGGGTFEYSAAYDTQGRIDTIAYPAVPGRTQRFAVRHQYGAQGYLQSISEVAQGVDRELWQARITDAQGRLTAETLGTSLATRRGFDARTGRLQSIDTYRHARGNWAMPLPVLPGQPGSSPYLQQLRYGYEFGGNLRQQQDLRGAGRSERFTYDALNRLRSATLGNGTSLQEWNYDLLGNITSAPIGAYAYQSVTNGQPRPHQVSSITAGQNLIESYVYDGVGNRTETLIGPQRILQRRLHYTSFNLPLLVEQPSFAQGLSTITYGYDAGHRRVIERSSAQDFRITVGDLYELVSSAGQRAHLFTVHAAGRAVAQIRWAENDPQGFQDTLSFVHADRMGSTEAISNAAGQVLQRLSYDPFGQRRNPDWTPSGTTLPASLFANGFTGHRFDEALGQGVVNMRGRLYDARLGRFFSADPVVGSSLGGQSLNRYSYVHNRPTAFTDPSGFDCSGCVDAPTSFGSILTGILNGIFGGLTPPGSPSIQIGIGGTTSNIGSAGGSGPGTGAPVAQNPTYSGRQVVPPTTAPSAGNAPAVGRFLQATVAGPHNAATNFLNGAIDQTRGGFLLHLFPPTATLIGSLALPGAYLTVVTGVNSQGANASVGDVLLSGVHVLSTVSGVASGVEAAQIARQAARMEPALTELRRYLELRRAIRLPPGPHIGGEPAVLRSLNMRDVVAHFRGEIDVILGRGNRNPWRSRGGVAGDDCVQCVSRYLEWLRDGADMDALESLSHFPTQTNRGSPETAVRIINNNLGANSAVRVGELVRGGGFPEFDGVFVVIESRASNGLAGHVFMGERFGSSQWQFFDPSINSFRGAPAVPDSGQLLFYRVIF